MALVMVVIVIVIGVAVALAYALLASASLQANVGANLARVAQAESLAESGVQLALFYLQDPSSAPSLNAKGFWPGGTGYSLGYVAGTVVNGGGNVSNPAGKSVPGTFDVQVFDTDESGAALPASTYRVESTGASGGSSRKVVATVLASPGVTNLAARFASSITLNPGWTATGNIETNGTLKVLSGASVFGYGRAHSISNSGYIQYPEVLSATRTLWVPDANAVHNFLPGSYTYTYNGLTYAATKLNLPATPYTIGNNTTLGPTATNPLGIYWADTDVSVLNSVTVNGVLIVRNAGLSIRGNGSSFNAPAGWPALLVDGDLTIEKNNYQLVINGLAWVGGDVTTIKTNTSSSYVTINGSLMVNGPKGIDPNFDSVITLNWDPRAAVAWFGVSAKPPSVRVLSWKS